jgi:hypothetical protein
LLIIFEPSSKIAMENEHLENAREVDLANLEQLHQQLKNQGEALKRLLEKLEEKKNQDKENQDNK